MSNNPNEIKSQDDTRSSQDKRGVDVLISAIEKCEKLERQLKIVLGILLRVSPQHEGYVRANFPNYFKELEK